MALRDLIARSIEEVRSTQPVKSKRQIRVSEFIEGTGAAVTLEAHARGLKLSVSPVQEGLAVETDQHNLAAVVGNLVQNAFKFTRPHSTV